MLHPSPSLLKAQQSIFSISERYLIDEAALFTFYLIGKDDLLSQQHFAAS
jgi:hypothetical protein